ncbi:MAG: YndJ family transporter [Planctomycetota bacterium]
MRSWTGRAVIGGCLWVVYVLISEVLGSVQNTGEVLLLWGSLVVVPLAVGLVDPSAVRGQRGRWAVARRLHLPCASLLLGSFLFAPGSAAGLLCLPWLMFTGLVALLGVLRFAERGGGPVHSLAVDAGLAFLVVGGVWTAASRFGATLMGFDEPWVLLTGIHFHFAGLVLPIVTGEVARRSRSLLGSLASIGVMAGVPLVAVGITAGARGLHTVEFLAALWLVMASMLTAALLLIVGVREDRVVARVLLCAAGLSLLVSMVLVAVYATGVWAQTSWLSIPTMILSHGVLNAFGFAFPALLALWRAGREDDVGGMEVLVLLLGDTPATGLWEARTFGSNPDELARVDVDLHERSLPGEEPGIPVANGSYHRVAEAIMRYEAFPPAELRAIVARTPVEVGDTLRCRYRLLPGMDLVFASRVVAVFDEERDGLQRTGFAYRTLAGHPICGEETFSVEKDLETGDMLVRIAARSRTDTWLTSLTRPLARRLQRRAGQAAVEHLRKIAVSGSRRAS